MLSVLRQRNFALFWAAALVSGVGDFVLLAALPYYVYATSGSALASAIAVVSEAAPVLVFSNLGGVFSDRWRRKPVMVSSELLRAVSLLPLLAVHGSSTLWIVYAAGFARASIGNFAGPFGGAAIPHVVPKANLPSANAAFSVATWIGVVVGAPMGGLLLQHGGLRVVAIVDALSFVVAASLVALVNVPLQAERHVTSKPPASIRLTWMEWIRGLAFIKAEPWLRKFFLIVVLAFFANGVVATIMAPFIRHTLGGSSQFFALCVTAQGVGGIGGGLLVGRVQGRFSPSRLLAHNLGILGGLNLAIAAVATQLAMLVNAFIAGVAVLFVIVSLTTIVQTHTPSEYLGRVFAAYLSANAAASICGALVAGQLGNTLGPRLTWGVGGFMMLLTGAIAYRVLRSEPVGGSREAAAHAGS